MRNHFEGQPPLEDPHRPQYHFLPPANWMNDPNGLIQWKNQFHLFYQYNPYGAFHGSIHWGHAVSTDLVHWRHLPVALVPTPDGPDKDGCWSGCAIDHNGIPTIFYTGVSPQVQCTATSSDDLLTWQKRLQPVIAAPPPDIREHAGGDLRDPFVWRQDGLWYMLLTSKIEGGGGLVLLYRSADTINWEYLHPLISGDVNQRDPFWTGTIWECPNLIDFGDKQVILVSLQGTPNTFLYVCYFTGEFRQESFTTHSRHILVPTSIFYAPQVMRLDDGRVILFSWILEDRTARSALQAGWSGMMSLPLECSLLVSGKLGLAPVRELQSLRKNHSRFVNLQPNGSFLPLQGQALEILARFEPAPGSAFGLKVRCSPDGQEQTLIICRDNQVIIDSERSSLNADVNRRITTLPVEIEDRINLHIFLDHSILEVFVNDQSYLVSRIYPSRPDSLGIGVFAEGSVNIPQLDVWVLESIWG